MSEEVLYRYERDTTCRVGILSLREIPVLRRTPCGAWVLDADQNRERFVLLPFGKWASETIEQAKERFLRRTRTCVARRRNELKRDEEYLRLAEAGKWDWRPEGDDDPSGRLPAIDFSDEFGP